MKFQLKFAVLVIAGALVLSCGKTGKKETTENTTTEVADTYVADNYIKKEVDIVMRDGVKLHTTIYSPKDASKEYPMIMQRTPYSSAPYGEGKFKKKIGPNINLMKEGNIIVYQDVRGRWMSEGHYVNMRAYIPNKTSNDQIDESSDTYDTIDWLDQECRKQ